MTLLFGLLGAVSLLRQCVALYGTVNAKSVMVVRVSKIVVRAIKLQDDFQEHVLGDHRHIPMTPNVGHHNLIQDRIPQRCITAHVKSKQGSTALLPDNNFRLHYGAGANPPDPPPSGKSSVSAYAIKIARPIRNSPKSRCMRLTFSRNHHGGSCDPYDLVVSESWVLY
jgi:hypothetical protein